MAAPKRREFLQLAERYDAEKHDAAGRYISEKLDGTRCFWDGGLSRGLPTETIPWAGVIDPKTGEKKHKIKPIATGLWSRYGNPIMAPDAFLNLLPCCPLDGELWAGRGQFQLCRSICAGDEPDPRFMDKITYAVYSSPSLPSVFASGLIKNTNMVCNLDYLQIEQWVRRRLNGQEAAFESVPIPKRCLGDDYRYLPTDAPFAEEVRFLHEALDNLDPDSRCYLHPQTRLTDAPTAAKDQVEAYLEKVLDQGGEGIVLRNPGALWLPKRHRDVLKYKPFTDAEARLVGFTAGRETDKGSRLLGKIGALIVDYKGKRLELAGLTDAEREFASYNDSQHAAHHAGKDMPPDTQGRAFKVGQMVTFKYRELSDDGIPKEARYWRRRDVE